MGSYEGVVTKPMKSTDSAVREYSDKLVVCG